MTDHKDMSVTMELDSILAEAKALRDASASQPAQARHALDEQDAVQPGTDHAEAPAAAADADDGFLFTEEDTLSRRPRRRRPRKSPKKPAIIAMVIVGALLVAGIAGFVIWKNSSSSQAPVAANVTVSGIDVGGMAFDDALSALVPAEQKIADTLRVEVACGDKKVMLTKGDFAYHFNTEEVLRQAQRSTADTPANYEIRLIVDDDGYEAALNKVAAEAEVKAQDAKVVKFTPEMQEMFTFAEAVSGQKLRRDELAAQLKKLFDTGKLSGSVTALLEEEKSAVTAEYLKKNIRLLSFFTTVSTNTWNGTENMRVSLAACNGSIIEPDGTWSFNACTGDSNLESNGYKPAGVINEGRHEIGIGGGICQSSTTIYNAGLLCGMTVVERYCHYYPSTYVDYGRDATIDYGNLDLKLKNPFTYQLFLKCYMDGDVLHAEIYGLPAKDFDEVRISTTGPTYTTTSYTVKASRAYYKDGKEVRSEELPSSTYYFSAPSPAETTAPTTAPTAPTTPVTEPTPTDAPPADDPSTQPGTEPGDEPGTEPSDHPGTEPIDQPVDPSADPGEGNAQNSDADAA